MSAKRSISNGSVTTKNLSNASTSQQSTGEWLQEQTDRKTLVLYRSPLRTLYYFFLECLYRLTQLRFTAKRHKRLCVTVMLTLACVYIFDIIKGPHTSAFQHVKTRLLWWSWWVWLGFLSSCGFGTGLHTFVLYLGPFIAEVTMSAYECGSLRFPRPPYPDRIICPDDLSQPETISFLRIMRKVQMESIMWGLGTAIGELPPYFMAQGARLSGKHDEEELAELEEILASNQHDATNHTNIQSISFQKKMELFLHRLILRMGFLGILLCASVPNPLFDLAGMTCGHFLVPFWSFFGATFIGKALIKVHIQQFTVIALSSEHHVETLVDLIGKLPIYGKRLQAPLLDYLQQQKANLHNKLPGHQHGWIQTVINFIVFSMVFVFLVSIVHAFAQNYHRRLSQWRHQTEGELVKKDD